MNGPLVTLTKHWAVVVEYLDEDGSVDTTELYEANNNGQGVVVANNNALKKRTSMSGEHGQVGLYY